uniref:Bap31 domain-containing protein n=1 Tax=Glossina pallidipes TaxID=7398 RepID=A0A1B0A7H3_GLOPL
MQRRMRFKAQRSLCISGFPIFLALVIRRLVTLISAQANLLDQNEATVFSINALPGNYYAYVFAYREKKESENHYVNKRGKERNSETKYLMQVTTPRSSKLFLTSEVSNVPDQVPKADLQNYYNRKGEAENSS